MGIQNKMIDVAKMRTSAYNGDAVAWILQSEFAEPWGGYNYCILVQAISKQSSQQDLDRLTTQVVEQDCALPLESWLESLLISPKSRQFFFCLDLPPFSKTSLTAIKSLLEVIERNSLIYQTTI